MGGNMRLRNKKTGEIVDVESVGHAESLKEKYGYQVTLSWKTEYENLSQCKDYHSLAELNEEWEDYTPAEPLIKDKEIISLLRPWIKFNKIEKARILKVSDCWFHIKGADSNDCWWDIEIHASYSKSVDKDYQGEFVDTEELCGEEE